MDQVGILRYQVPDMSCSHCETAVREGIASQPGVRSVVIDLGCKLVEVTGQDLDDAAIRKAIGDAGYEAE
jgi:copper chaperone